jgi:type IV secretory pathway VirB9-like protein
MQDIFGRAIQRYIQNPDKKQLLFCLLDWMTGQGYSVDSSSRNLLLKNAQLFGQKQLIAEILAKQQAASRITGQRTKMFID